MEINTQVTGTLNVSNGITGSLQGTASWAGYSISASHAEFTTTSSYATSASYAVNAVSASYTIRYI